MAKFRPKVVAAPTTKPCPECLSEIPIAAKRCMYCTVEVPPVPPVPLARHAR